MFSILITLILALSVSSCGDAESSDSIVVSESFDGRCTISLKSSTSGSRCIDYEDLSASQVSSSEAACVDSDTETKVFETGSLCEDSGKLGGCQLPKSAGVSVTTWTYSTGNDSVDAGVTELAKAACESPADGGVEGVWVENGVSD